MALGDVQIYIDDGSVVMQVGDVKVWCSAGAGAEFLGLLYNMLQQSAITGSKVAYMADQWTRIVEN